MQWLDTLYDMVSLETMVVKEAFPIDYNSEELESLLDSMEDEEYVATWLEENNLLDDGDILLADLLYDYSELIVVLNRAQTTNVD